MVATTCRKDNNKDQKGAIQNNKMQEDKNMQIIGMRSVAEASNNKCAKLKSMCNDDNCE